MKKLYLHVVVRPETAWIQIHPSREGVDGFGIEWGRNDQATRPFYVIATAEDSSSRREATLKRAMGAASHEEVRASDCWIGRNIREQGNSQFEVQSRLTHPVEVLETNPRVELLPGLQVKTALLDPS